MIFLRSLLYVIFNNLGVDESTCGSLLYSSGKTGSVVISAKVELPNEAHIVGTKGIIKVLRPSIL